MFQQSSLQFLKDLKKHNQKEWFEKNRGRYDNTKKELEAFTENMIARISKFDPSVAHVSVKDCLFRLNRDIRFSKDKTPYKTHLAMYVSKGGKKSSYPGYYFHLEPGASRIAGGLWMPMPGELKKVRQEIDYNWEDFQKIIQHKKFRSVFGDFRRGKDEMLSRPPKGYDDTSPAINYLKLKSWVVSATIADEELLSVGLAKKMAERFATLYPLVQFFHRALDE